MDNPDRCISKIEGQMYYLLSSLSWIDKNVPIAKDKCSAIAYLSAAYKNMVEAKFYLDSLKEGEDNE